MNITGLDALVFGVNDVESCRQYLRDYGLEDVGENNFAALDGTYIQVLAQDDAALPTALESGNMLRKTIYGVADQTSLNDIAAELGKDREVKTLSDGSLESTDDLGFALGFQLSVRKPLAFAVEAANAPGVPPQRKVNAVAADADAKPKPRSLSHVVYFVPNVARAEAFYVNRLGFTCTDRFTGVGPFLRPQGSMDHHSLFMIETPPFMQGCEHFTFHVGGPTELMQAGTQFVEKGYESFWGPGRHIFGSNWFWYFNSPFGCHVEYDADMDLVDEQWAAREISASEDSSQLFLLQSRDKWFPSGGPPGKD